MNYLDYKVIIDTDIGDDIDDAFALGLAIKSQCDLGCITTVYKNTLLRAKQAKQMLELMNKDIPVYYGESKPLSGVITSFPKDTGDLEKVKPCQYDEGMDKYVVNEGAVGAIIKMAKQYSGKLVIVPIGPLTNIACAIKEDPSIVNDIYGIYTMGGCFSFVSPEWNILCDPEAANIVYSSGLNIRAIGFDITTKCPLDKDVLEELKETNKELNSLIFKWFDRWINYFHFEKSVLHDPLALSTFIDNDICTFKMKYCKVILEGDNRGAIETSDNPQEGYFPIYVATDVNKLKFFKLFKDKFN